MISEDVYWKAIHLLEELAKMWSVSEATEGEIMTWLNQDDTPENREGLSRVFRAFRKIMDDRLSEFDWAAFETVSAANQLKAKPQPVPLPLHCHSCDETIPLAGVAHPFHVVCPACWEKMKPEGGKA